MFFSFGESFYSVAIGFTFAALETVCRPTRKYRKLVI